MASDPDGTSRTVKVIARLVAIERAPTALARLESPDCDPDLNSWPTGTGRRGTQPGILGTQTISG